MLPATEGAWLGTVDDDRRLGVEGEVIDEKRIDLCGVAESIIKRKSAVGRYCYVLTCQVGPGTRLAVFARLRPPPSREASQIERDFAAQSG